RQSPSTQFRPNGHPPNGKQGHGSSPPAHGPVPPPLLSEPPLLTEPPLLLSPPLLSPPPPIVPSVPSPPVPTVLASPPLPSSSDVTPPSLPQARRMQAKSAGVPKCRHPPTAEACRKTCACLSQGVPFMTPWLRGPFASFETARLWRENSSSSPLNGHNRANPANSDVKRRVQTPS